MIHDWAAGHLDCVASIKETVGWAGSNEKGAGHAAPRGRAPTRAAEPSKSVGSQRRGNGRVPALPCRT